MKALIGTFNQEKALVEALFVIVKTSPINRLQLYTGHTIAQSTYCHLHLTLGVVLASRCQDGGIYENSFTVTIFIM